MKHSGYIVMERADEYEQALVLRKKREYPSGGILDWGERQEARAVFPSRAAARQAIDRTEHYRLAFGLTTLPERAYCVVVPCAAVESP